MKASDAEATHKMSTKTLQKHFMKAAQTQVLAACPVSSLVLSTESRKRLTCTTSAVNYDRFSQCKLHALHTSLLFAFAHDFTCILVFTHVDRPASQVCTHSCMSKHMHVTHLGKMHIVCVWTWRIRHTLSRFIFCVFGLRPVAINIASSPSMDSFCPPFFSTCKVRLPSAFFMMPVGVLCEWMLRPEVSYCSAMKLRHSSSNPLSGSGCKQHRHGRLDRSTSSLQAAAN